MDHVARKEALKRALYHVIAYTTHFSGVQRLRGSQDAQRPLRVLMYHKINDRRDSILSVPSRLFDEQMSYLKARYNVVSPDDVLADLSGGEPLPPRAAMLTFDDGYADVFEQAYPILERYGLPAALFLATDFIDQDVPFPHDARFPGQPDRALSWAQVRAMADRIEMGAHACSHRTLTTLPPEIARREIFESKARIEDQLGRPVRLFAYPSGGPLDFNARLRQWVIEAGYHLCFTTIPKTNRRPFDAFALGRYNVEPYGAFYFQSLLEGGCDLWGLAATRWGAHLKRALVSKMGATT
jgi:peptidoglycan/xylan/chitin deacetylase (PgdA/CDA1 family)